MFDPYQLVAVAQRLTAAGLPMQEFPQTVSNLTEASTNLYELIKGRNLMAYPDADMRLSASRAVALETSRGWRIAKEKQSHKIDVVVALAQAALGAVKGGQASAEPGIIGFYKHLAWPGRFAIPNAKTVAQAGLEYERVRRPSLTQGRPGARQQVGLIAPGQQ